MMKIRYIYSACVSIDTGDAKILCDPWFTDGIYDGSWFQYPKLSGDPVEIIGPHDFIYISHIHPDHFDPEFLKRYLAKFPETKILIADFKYNYLSGAMDRHAIPHEVGARFTRGDTELFLRPHAAPDEVPLKIDSWLLVGRGNECVLNWNDCGEIQDDVRREIVAYAGGKKFFVLWPASGAGDFPQMHMPISPRLTATHEAKRNVYLGSYAQMQDMLRPLLSMPFAGSYMLGGRHHGLNMYRGAVDPVEYMKKFENVVALADGGEAYADLTTQTINYVRGSPYSSHEIDAAAAQFAFRPMSYEYEDLAIAEAAPDWEALLTESYVRATTHSVIARDFYFSLSTPIGWFSFNVNQSNPHSFFGSVDDCGAPYSKIQIDPRYLRGFMTRKYNWNNGFVGSHFLTRSLNFRQIHFESGFFQKFYQ